jgi:hypothetical protein
MPPGQAIIESADYFVSGLIEEENTIIYVIGVHWLVDIREARASPGKRGHPNLKDAFRPGPLK